MHPDGLPTSTAWSSLCLRTTSFFIALLLLATNSFGQTIELENLDVVPFPDRLVFSRIGNPSEPWAYGMHERAVLRIRNTGGATLSVNTLAISGPDAARFALETPPTLPLTVAAGASTVLPVKFTAESGFRIHTASLTIGSNDPAKPSVVVQLRGFWQRTAVNIQEPTLEQIVDLFGYQTDVVYPGQDLNIRGKIETTGEEVLSSYWRRADVTKPVSVRQLAAFHSYPDVSRVRWHYKGSTTLTTVITHHSDDSQTVHPRKLNLVDPAAGTFSPLTTTAGGVFGLRLNLEWSDPALNDKTADDCSGGITACGHHVRFWPARDRQGVLIPNTFIVSMDASGINYDYQDNVYILSNVKPENPIAGLDNQIVRINAGGPAVTTSGLAFLADVYSSAGGTWSPRCNLGDIKNTVDDDLYRTEYSDGNPFYYNIPAVHGVYRVRLHFAEIAYGSCTGAPGGPGIRVFDVWLEGAKVLSNFDISAEVPAVTALVKEFYVDLTDGIISMEFPAISDFGMISAIEVFPSSVQLPVAHVSASPISGPAPLLVAFNAGASTDDGFISAYTWAFGDGTTGNGVTTSHTYSSVGTYTAAVTVTDNEGATAIATVPITVTDSSPISNFTNITWSIVKAQPFENAEGQGTVMAGKLYSFGGFDSQKTCCTPTKRSYAYDPLADTWAILADLPYANNGGATHHGVTTDGTNIYLAGGFISNAAGTGQIFGTKEVWRYNVASNTYTSLPGLPVERAGGQLEHLNGKLHYFGGTNIQRTVDVGDHYVLNLSNLAAGWTTAAPLPNPRHHLASVVLGGSIYAIGGQHNHDANLVPQASVHAYNPNTNIWTAVADLPSPRSHHTAVVQGGRIISIGGEGQFGTTLANLDAYNPSTNSWTPLTPLPAARRSGVAGSINGILYYTGGNSTKRTYKGVPENSPLNELPSASFTTTPSSGVPPLQVAFNASASTDNDGTIVQYAWNFGDGGTGAGVTVNHTFAEAGDFLVTLVVTDDDGGTATTTATIAVSEGDVSYFQEADGQVVLEAERFQLKIDRGGHGWTSAFFTGNVGSAMLSSPNSNTNIDSNIATSSPELSYTVRFNTTGTYYVWARVWGETAADDSFHAGLNGVAVPTADRMTLKAAQLGSWKWVNVTMDSNSRATLNVQTGGLQTIHLWMREDGLYVDRLLLTTNSAFAPTGTGPAESPFINTSNNAPLAAFAATPESGVAPLEIAFDASGSTDDGSIVGYVWNFGDGSGGGGVNTTHTYSTDGTYNAVLVVTDDLNATDTTTVEITVDQATLPRPSVTGTSPENGATGVPRDVFIAADVTLPNVGQGIDASTLTAGTVRLYPSGNPGAAVDANRNTSGGGDAIVLQPSTLLAANTPYVFEVTDGLKDLSGAAFIPMQISFTTSSLPNGTENSAVAFEKVSLPSAVGKHTTLTMGPDGKLYATQHDGLIKRWTIEADGTLSNLETISSVQLAEGGNRLLVGLAFDPASTAEDLIAWVTHTTFGFSGMADWGGKISKLTGPNLETVQDYVVNLPRSIRDHGTYSLAFGPDGAIYVNQGSNSAMGAPDNAWGNRPERMLSAATLRVDVAALEALPSLPLNVRTDDGSYDPFEPDSPVKIFASGIRNAYDLVWHSNGFLYIPTNGSAANGNAPASIPGTMRPNGQPYSGPAVPAIDSVETQNDFLFRVPPPSGGSWAYRYYGHPNPERGEFALNGGNPTSLKDPAQVDRYPVGIAPDAAWGGLAFNFDRNVSPNGAIEYQSDAFDGLLQGKLLVVRYSGGDDIIVLEPHPSTGDILPDGDETGIAGFTQFSDPLDLTENPVNGHLYVSEYGDLGTITLLRPTIPVEENDPPVASFVATPTSGEVPLQVAFDASGSTDPDGTIVTYGWDFDGDAVVDTTIADGPLATFTYDSAESYNATLIVTDDDEAIGTSTVVVTVTDPSSPAFVYVEQAGQAVMESETFDGNISRSGKTWTQRSQSGSVGASMRAEPVTTTNIDTGFATTSPELQYRVLFTTAGTYYIWMRANGGSGNSDSWHVGLDGQPVASADRMTIGNGFNVFKWINNTMDAARATLQIPSPGTYTVNVWMREDGVYLDRMLLTSDLGFVPTGTGPAPSERIQVGGETNAPPIADFTAAPLFGPLPLSVAFDASNSSDPDGTIVSYAWDFDGDTVIDTTITDSPLAEFTYTENGNFEATLLLTDNDGGTATESSTITVIDPGAPTLAFLESDGQVVMESESFEVNISRSDKIWTEYNLAGDVGTSMRAEPVTQTTIDTGFAAMSPEMRYRVQFTTAGTYFVWMRARGLDGSSDSWHVGLDDQPLASADRMMIGSGFNAWKWINTTMDPARATLLIPAPGAYIVNVWMREDGVYLDRMLLSINAALVPTGTGPAESPQFEMEGVDALIASETDLALAKAQSAVTLPEHFALESNYPNPFNPVTTIRYALPEEAHVRLEVYDLLGRRVSVLVDDVQRPGFHNAVFDGAGLASGVYLYRFEAGPFTKVSRMVLMK